MRPLPIDDVMPRILGTLETENALVLVSPPGSGKTTRIPPALAAHRPPEEGRVVLLQPRRIAALAAAHRIAEERGWSVGREIGYEVRFARKGGPDSRIVAATTGVFLRQIQRDPFLQGTSTVILDEFHERDLEIDLILALLKEVRDAGREDLRILVMSATLEAQSISSYLDPCPIIEFDAPSFPVETVYCPPTPSESISSAIARVLPAHWREGAGNTLIFLPGWSAIRKTELALASFAAEFGAEILPLHGTLPLAEQQRVLAPTEHRKLILSTNVAETSLTVPGVDVVVDCGWVRILVHDARSGIDRLETTRVSQFSARQRAGRAGRVGPGRVIRLYRKHELARFEASPPPAVRRVDLSRAFLELKRWGTPDPSEFAWFEAPDPKSLRRARDLLEHLEAIAPDGSLTKQGAEIQRLPCHPRIGRLLLTAKERNLPREGALLAALLEERDILSDRRRANSQGESRTPRSGPSDLLDRFDRFELAERDGFRPSTLRSQDLDPGRISAVRRARDQLLSLLGLRDMAPPAPPSTSRETRLLRLLLQGYSDRVFRRREPRSPQGKIVGGRGVTVTRESIVLDGEFALALQIDAPDRTSSNTARVRAASLVEAEWLRKDFPGAIRTEIRTWFDEDVEKVRATKTECYRDLPLEPPRESSPDPQTSRDLLEPVLRERALEIANRDPELRSLLVRLRGLGTWCPELDLPRLGQDALAALLLSTADGKRSLHEFARPGLLFELVRGHLGFETNRILDREAPKVIQVPSGSRIRLEYADDKPPVLSVRVQEVFGLAQTPRIACGRMPVLLQLLGPNSRPVQRTRDLESFWDTTYAQVRKDLRGRYPKHSWPEDPRNAQPTRGIRRKSK